jgi:lysozyme family protein
LHCDALPAGLDYAIFDYGVNSGIARAAKVLQRALGIAADGVIGPVTLAGVARSVASTLIMAVCDERLRFLQSLHTWPVFGKGWGRRVAEVRRAALAMAAQQGG